MTTSSSTSKSTAKAPAKAAKTPAKTASAPKAKATAASKSSAKTTAKAAAHAPAKAAAGAKAKPRDDRTAFMAEQRQLLLDERANYIRSAESLKAQADSLALEHEPGDVQFDEEGGEGGTSNVDRELDLVLSAQARAAAAEIDRALEKIENGTYGLCEQCGEPIPDARLQALPQAALCVACKSGGLSSRR
jgi:DnaK suppressor protein